MPDALTLYLTLSPRSGQLVGAGLRIQAQPQDSAGNVASITGVLFTVVAPDGSETQFSGGGLGTAAIGPYLDLVQDQAGAWRVRVECTGPRAAAVERSWTVSGSDVVAPATPGPVWATRDLWALYSQQGQPITAVRVPALPALPDAADLDATDVPVAYQEVTYKTGLGRLATAAAALALVASNAAITAAVNSVLAATMSTAVFESLQGTTPVGLVGDGSADDLAAINYCIASLCAGGGGVLKLPLPAVKYRCVGGLTIPANADKLAIIVHPNARLEMDYTPGSQGGLVQNADVAGAAANTNRPKRIRIEGGSWGVPYTAAADLSASATTRGGNIVNLICDDLHLFNMRFEGLGPAGRFYVGLGDRVTIDNCWMAYSLKATGSGGVRYGGGSRLLVRNCFILSGDDACQVVPASVGPTINIDVGDVTFQDCIGGSWAARWLVVGVGDRTDGPYLSGAVRSSGVATYSTVNKSGAPVAHGLRVGASISASGSSDPSFDGVYTILSVPTTSTFTVANAGADASSTGGSLVSGLTTAVNSVVFRRCIGFGTGRSISFGNNDSAGCIAEIKVIECNIWNGDTAHSSTLPALCLVIGSDYVITARNGKPGIGKIIVEDTQISGGSQSYWDIGGDVGDVIFRNVDHAPLATPNQIAAIYCRRAKSFTMIGGSVDPGPGQAAIWLGQTTGINLVDRWTIDGVKIIGMQPNADGTSVTPAIRATNVGGGRIINRTYVEVGTSGLVQVLSINTATSSVRVESVEVIGTPNAVPFYDGAGVLSFGFDLIPPSLAGTGGGTGVQNVDVSSIAGGVLTWDGKANVIKVTGTTPASITTITPSSTPASSMRVALYLAQNGSLSLASGGNLVMPFGVTLKQTEAIEFGWNAVLSQMDMLSTTSAGSLRDAIFASLPTSDPGAGKAWNSGGVVEISQ